MLEWSLNHMPDGMEYHVKPQVEEPMLSKIHEDLSHLCPCQLVDDLGMSSLSDPSAY